MPTISVFVRKEDLPKWQALAQKSEWLHQHLNTNSTTSTILDRSTTDEHIKAQEKLESKQKEKSQAVGDIQDQRQKDVRSVFPGADDVTKEMYGDKAPDRTRVVVPGVSTINTSKELKCCSNMRNRCQHWDFDRELCEYYINTLSGRKIEVGIAQ